MLYDFKSPQKQSVTGVVIMFADTLQSVIRAVWAPLLIVLFKLDPQKYILVVVSFLVIVLLIGVVAFLKYKNFTFFLDQEKQEFIVSKGVLNKSNIAIQLSKIQQVNINQSLIQKIVGVYSLDIDTAGTDKKEISIRAIDQNQALLLKKKLLEYDEISNSTKIEFPDNELIENKEPIPFIKISYLTLFKVGITSKYGRTIAILITFVLTLFQTFKDAVTTFEIDETQVNSVFNYQLGLYAALVLLIGVFVLVLFINIIRTFIKYFDFEMMQHKKAMIITSGLLAKKNTLLNPNKVQIIAIGQNFFQKKLGIFDMNTRQASSSDENERRKQSNVVEIPGCDENEKNKILEVLLDKILTYGSEYIPNYRYLIFKIIFRIIVPIAIFVGLSYTVIDNLWFYLPLFVVYLCFVGFMIIFGYKNYRMHSNTDFIILKQGAWDVENQILQPHKIQSITTKQYFWHKSSDVGHLTLHTAAGDVKFQFGNFTEIKKLVNCWLYQVETTTKNWM